MRQRYLSRPYWGELYSDQDWNDPNCLNPEYEAGRMDGYETGFIRAYRIGWQNGFIMGVISMAVGGTLQWLFT